MSSVVEPVVPRYVLAPYVPTPEEVVERMLDLACVGPTDVVFDLGCGDGRIAIGAASRGAHGVGVDIEPYWVEEARAAARRVGVSDLVEFRCADALAADVAGATVVALYLVEWSTALVGEKLLRELSPGARIVSHSFSMTFAPARVERWMDVAGERRTIRLWVV